MAKEPTSHTVEIDGNRLLTELRGAGLQPEKLDLKHILGGKVDVHELESRLRAPTTGTEAARAGGWHVTVTVSVSRD